MQITEYVLISSQLPILSFQSYLHACLIFKGIHDEINTHSRLEKQYYTSKYYSFLKLLGYPLALICL